eukprot:Clim_evm102s153 gene=Clim_evmTU102s153
MSEGGKENGSATDLNRAGNQHDDKEHKQAELMAQRIDSITGRRVNSMEKMIEKLRHTSGKHNNFDHSGSTSKHGDAFLPAARRRDSTIATLNRCSSSSVFRLSTKSDLYTEKALILVMVGLPARGKSFLSQRIVQYFRWKGISARLFNVGNKRRVAATGEQDAKFFSAENKNAAKQRDELAMEVLDELLDWIGDGGQVAIFDATNTTKARRNMVRDRTCNHSTDPQVVFLESICDNDDVIQRNLRQKIRNSPDYRDKDEEAALRDLNQRIANYKKVYEPVDDAEEASYLKLINMQSKVIINKCYGTKIQQLVALMMATWVGDRSIYLSRAGATEKISQEELDELEDNGSISSFKSRAAFTDSLPLSQTGREYAEDLAEFMHRELRDEVDDLKIYTSTLPRAIQTAQPLQKDIKTMSSLNPLDTGICHGMTVEEIRKEMPEEYAKFIADPFNYTIPGGESFKDLIHAAENLIIDIERQRAPVLIVSHLSTLQIILGYFGGLDFTDSLRTPIPAHSVVKITRTVEKIGVHVSWMDIHES